MIVESTKPICLETGSGRSNESPALQVDLSLQSRAAMNPAIVDAYAERMKAGDVFPPIVAFSDGTNLLLADGFHRFSAGQKAGLPMLAVEVRLGTRKDAIRHAITANASHGLPRTNADKHRAVGLALQEFADLSDHAIAELCKVSQPFVSSVRRGLKIVISSGKRVGRDGRKRSLPARRTRQVPTDEKATQPGSMIAGEATADHEQQSNGEFCMGEAWNRIERFLSAELTTWPANMRGHLRKQLQKFIDRNC